MKETNQLHIAAISLTDAVLLSHSKTNLEAYKYFLTRNFRKEYFGTLISGYYFDLIPNLNLKQLKIEIFK
jgi:hypothetical protein